MGLHPLATSDKSPPLSEAALTIPTEIPRHPAIPGPHPITVASLPPEVASRRETGPPSPRRAAPQSLQMRASASGAAGAPRGGCRAAGNPRCRPALPSLRLGAPFICSPGGAVRSDVRPVLGDGDRVRRRNTAQASRTHFLSHHSTRAADAEAAGRGSSDAPGRHAPRSAPRKSWPSSDLYSVAYALVLGAADALAVPQQDLNVTFSRQAIILYDDVPGGAGLVAQLRDEGAFRRVVECSRDRVAGGCGCDTSCYGCLRSYRNQFVHTQLDRRAALRVLEAALRRGGRS